VKFIDEATITVHAGDGGRGCVSFRREKYVPRGGPDGGDGGRGGDVIFLASLRRRTLRQFQFKSIFKAANGGHGQGRQKAGHGAEDLIIEVPLGTRVEDAQTGERLCDLTGPDDRFVAARGGRGGLGNTRFKSSTNRAPRHAQPGEAGQQRVLKLELRLLADVGLVGLPNAGKSTLIAAISAARPKIADYPFTTLNPVLGVVQLGWAEPFVVADIPGIIEGAHEGAGLGIQFLKHVERTRVLVHLVDATQLDPEDPLRPYRTIKAELACYSAGLAAKPQIVVLNKLDRPEAAALAERFREAAGDPDILTISALERDGLQALLSRITLALETPHGN
jgi:GTP-binding protein